MVFSLDRPAEKIKAMEEYLKTVHLFRNFTDASQDPIFSEVCYPCVMHLSGITY